MTSLDHLLPEPDQAVRCTEHRRQLSIDPAGTAIRADRVVLIETPRPWPKPVFAHPWLSDVRPILDASTMPTRTLAFADDVEVGTTITFDRSDDGSTVIERRFRTDTANVLVALAEALAADDQATLSTMAESERVRTEPAVLVCIQGSHDVCCGSEGERFAAEAAALGGIDVYRVSHTGGHRFAPTAMTLPDGRMWADLDTTVLAEIVTRTGDPAALATRCRGWWGADTGPAQVAERAVFATAGWEIEPAGRTVTLNGVDAETRSIAPSPSPSPSPATPSAGRSLEATVTAGARTWDVVVTPGRTVPTIACRQPGGLPAKQATEYRVDSVLERTEPTRS